MGCIHIYTGRNAKNLKTALGMALRAIGAGFSVGFYSFGEIATDINALKNRLPDFEIFDMGQDISQFDMIILHDCELADHSELQKFLSKRPQDAEIVLCGTAFSYDVLEMANLISEIVTL
jgi:ATP:corrinoid adenosyltransferase